MHVGTRVQILPDATIIIHLKLINNISLMTYSKTDKHYIYYLFCYVYIIILYNILIKSAILVGFGRGFYKIVN